MPIVRQFSTARFGRHGQFSGLGATSPSSLDLGTSNNSDINNINSGIKIGSGILSSLREGDIRDSVRKNRVNVIQSLALAGSVLAAQICLAGPSNTASNEQQYWTTAQQTVSTQRPDVWAAAKTAGPWWPVGQPFNMTAVRQEICANLASNGIVVNSAACTAPFGTGCTDEGGTCTANNPITVTVTGVTSQVVTSAPPTAPGQPTSGTPTPTTTTVPLLGGSSNTLMLLAIVGAAAYYIMNQRKRSS